MVFNYTVCFYKISLEVSKLEAFTVHRVILTSTSRLHRNTIEDYGNNDDDNDDEEVLS